MLGRGIRKLRKFVFDSEVESLVLERFSENPLVAYLQVHFDQHRSITMLYRVLLLAFMGFIGVISTLILTNLETSFIPGWGYAALTALNLFLLFGAYLGLRQLKNYRSQAQIQLAEVYEQLKSDLHRIEAIKEDHSLLTKVQKTIKKRMHNLGSLMDDPVENYEGWDVVTCPDCKTKVEMETEHCPNCDHSFSEITAH